MNCNQTKDLLLSDYADGEIGLRKKKEIERHLRSCETCRAFWEVLQKETVKPFKNAPEVNPPDYVWYRIKEKIEAKALRRSSLSLNIFEKIRNRFIFYPVPVLAAVFAVILIFTAIFAGSRLSAKTAINEYLAQGAESLASIDVNGEDAGFDTVMEKVFL